MNLLAKLTVTAAATAIPALAVLSWVRSEVEERAEYDALRDLLLSRVTDAWVDQCEENPADSSWGRGGPGRGARGPGFPRPKRPNPFEHPEPRGSDRHGPEPWEWKGPGASRGPRPESGTGRGPPPRLEIFAYGLDFVSPSPDAPPFPPELRAKLEGEGLTASGAYLEGERTGKQVALRVEGRTGPCSIFLARRLASSRVEAPLVPRIWIAAAVLGAFIASVAVAAGPVVRRVRRLTAEVRKAAGSQYAEPIDVRGGDEIAELARAFNQAGAELRGHLARLGRREATLRGFVANTTHDVLLPLTVLQGHLVSLKATIDRNETLDRGTVLDAIEETHYMASLIQNLGAAVKLEATEAPLQKHEVDLNALVERVAGRHRPIARQKGIHLEHCVPERPVKISGDVTLLEQAVSNLAHNAVRYNKEGGHVALLLEVVKGEPSGFSLRVIDDGPGLPDEAFARITERFFRTDEARRRHPDGLGLGLHIAKGVAEAHGFSLTIRRVEPTGLETELRGALPEPGAH